MPIFDVEANGKQFEVEAPNMEAAIAGLQQHFNVQPEAENSVAGSAKALGVGGVKGLVGLAGAPADLADLGARGVDYLAGTKLQDYTKPVAETVGYEGLKKKLEGYTGPLYEPKTGTEKVLQTLGEFGSIGMLGPGSLARKALTQVAAPALASEAAGAATEGTAAEPYARIAGAITGAGAASKIGRMADARAAMPKQITSEELSNAVPAAYNTQAIKDVRYAPAAVEKVADRIQQNLKAQYFDAPQTYKQLDLMKTPMNGPTHSIQDVDNVRRRLNELKGAGGAEGEAARQAVQFIDNVLPHMGKLQGGVVAGNAKLAAADLKAARATAAANFRNEALQQIIERAANNAGATHSGGNLENELRKGVRSFINNPKNLVGFSLDEKAALRAFARGSVSANILRRIGKLFGGGGGLGQLASSAMGSAVAGPAGMIAAPALGLAANKLGSAVALNNLNRIAGDIRMRSPVGAAVPPPPPLPLQLSAGANGLLSGLRAATLPTAPQLLPFSYQ